jgi:hypothetical protein
MLSNCVAAIAEPSSTPSNRAMLISLENVLLCDKYKSHTNKEGAVLKLNVRQTKNDHKKKKKKEKKKKKDSIQFAGCPSETEFTFYVRNGT